MITNAADSLQKLLKEAHPRTRKAQLNTLFGLLIKAGGVIISLLLVPLTIDYLNKDVYGTWLTITSIVTMITFFDIGVGNGLRNRLSEAVTNQDMELARAYVSTAYLIFGILQLILISLFLVIVQIVPWKVILNTTIDSNELQTVILIIMVGINIKLVIDILSYVLLALQKSSYVALINLSSNALVLIGTYALAAYSKHNIIYLGAVTSISPIVVSLIAGFILYRNKLKTYQPKFRYAKIKYLKELLSLGYKFFIIQIAVVILFYSDNIIITRLFGPSEVTTYNISFRYFNAINSIFIITITPYWSAYTEAYNKNEFIWMRNTYSYLKKLWIVLVIVVAFMVLVSDPIYKIWVGDRVVVPMTLSLCAALFTIISCWNSVNVTIANGIGKVKMQLYYSVISATINVPLSIYLGRVLNMGSAGVMLATSLSLLIGSIIGKIQAEKILSNNAKGVWAS